LPKDVDPLEALLDELEVRGGEPLEIGPDGLRVTDDPELILLQEEMFGAGRDEGEQEAQPVMVREYKRGAKQEP
jgi:hypothetical protein